MFQVVEGSGAARARTYFVREAEAVEVAAQLAGRGAPLVLIETWDDGRRGDLRLIRCDAWPAAAAADRRADD